MNLKQAFLAALKAREHHDALLKLVRRYHAQGMTPQESYNALEEIWMDFGFDASGEDSPLRDDLEYVMERVWFQSSPSR
jgi:hypothetical protein